MFDSLFKVAIGVVRLPVDVVADVVTLGGALTDQHKPYTAKTAEQIIDNLDDATRPEAPNG